MLAFRSGFLVLDLLFSVLPLGLGSSFFPRCCQSFPLLAPLNVILPLCLAGTHPHLFWQCFPPTDKGNCDVPNPFDVLFHLLTPHCPFKFLFLSDECRPNCQATGFLFVPKTIQAFLSVFRAP